jgi:predicted Zn-ribbon and HTH transcriptional regulator
MDPFNGYREPEGDPVVCSLCGDEYERPDMTTSETNPVRWLCPTCKSDEMEVA